MTENVSQNQAFSCYVDREGYKVKILFTFKGNNGIIKLLYICPKEEDKNFIPAFDFLKKPQT